MQLRRPLALALVALAGCAASSPAQQVPTSGWLSDYAGFEDDRPGLLYRAEPGASFAGYQALRLEPVEVYPPDPTESADAPRRTFASRLERVLGQRLRERFDLVEAAGPGVLVVRFAVTEAEAGAVVNQGGFYRGGACVEAEFLDGESRRQLAAAVARRLGGKSIWVKQARPEDAQAVAETWAQSLIRALIDGGLTARPTPGAD